MISASETTDKRIAFFGSDFQTRLDLENVDCLGIRVSRSEELVKRKQDRN